MMLTCLLKVHKVELIVGSVIEEPVPKAQTRDFIVPKTPLCDTCTDTCIHTYMEAHAGLIMKYRQTLIWLQMCMHTYIHTYTHGCVCMHAYIHNTYIHGDSCMANTDIQANTHVCI